MFDWPKQSPIYVPELSRAHFLSRDMLFSAGDLHLHAKHPQPLHWHDCYEMGFVLHGNGYLVESNHAYAYVPNQVYIVNSMEPHMAYASESTGDLFTLHFHPALIDDGILGHMRSEVRLPFLSDFNTDGPLLALDDPVASTVLNMLKTIRVETISRDPVWEVVVSGLLIAAIGQLARRMVQSETVSDAQAQRRDALVKIAPVLHLIETAFADAISLDDMADAAHVSRSYCCALFNAALNTTPIAYRNSRRLAEAKKLLEQTDKPVQAIAYQVGFANVQEFNRLFRREVNKTPTEFREQTIRK